MLLFDQSYLWIDCIHLVPYDQHSDNIKGNDLRGGPKII